MAMPEINISYKTLATTLATRSARGVACIVVKNETAKGKYVYTRKKQIKENWSKELQEVLEDSFDRYGTNKIIVYSLDSEEIANVLKALTKVEINFMAFNFDVTSDIETIKAFVKTREANNMDVQVVVAGIEADNKYFINFVSEDIKVNGEAMAKELFTCKLACLLASIPMTESATFYVLNDVTGVTEIEDEDGAVDKGQLFITFDGEKYKLSRAVNSMTTLGGSDKKSCKKIKIVEGMSLVKGDIFKLFRDKYTGKNNNDYTHRIKLIGEINKYFLKLVDEGILNADAENTVELDVQAMRDYIEGEVGVDTSDMSDMEVLKDINGHCGSKVFLTGNVFFVDAMEDLDLILGM